MSTTQTTGGRELVVPAELVRREYNGTSSKVDLVVQVAGCRQWRHGVGYVAPDQTGRQVDGGPMVPGPWAYTFGLCTTIDNYGGTAAESSRRQAEGREISVAPGDVLVIDGVRFVVGLSPDGFHVTLAQVA